MRSNTNVDKIVLKLSLGKEVETDNVPRVGLYPPQKIFIYEMGFLVIQPRFLRADKIIAHRYQDITSIKILCASPLRYRYFAKNGTGNKYGDYDREENLSSLSRKLMKAIRADIESRLWAKINSDVQDNKEFAFGRFVVHKDYLRIIDGKQSFPISKIKEVKFYLSSEDNAFQIEFKPEFKKDFFWTEQCVYIQHIDNPFLFVKALKMLKIPVNLSAVPDLVD